MLILLPPSEAKTTRRRGRCTDETTLSFPALTEPRRAVAAALAEVSVRTDAAEVLRVSPALGEEIARNTRLQVAPAVPVRELYTGVLYDALDHAGMDAAARGRATRRIVVVSALYGALRLNDAVAAYRLSMAVRLPGVGALAGYWRPRLSPLLTAAAGGGVVVDCRSTTYAGAGKLLGGAATRWVQVRVPGVSHHAKLTRGLVAGHLCRSDGRIGTVEQLATALAAPFDVELSAPSAAGRPWQLDVQPADGAATRITG